MYPGQDNRRQFGRCRPSGRGARPVAVEKTRQRFMRNKAAVAGLVALILITLFAFFGGFLARWSAEEIDWAMMGNVAQAGGPSIANGHYFGDDELGRDLYARTVKAHAYRCWWVSWVPPSR